MSGGIALIIDDIKGNATLAAEVLSDEGYEVLRFAHQSCRLASNTSVDVGGPPCPSPPGTTGHSVSTWRRAL